MEKGADGSSGLNVLDRKTSLNSDFVRWMKSTATGSNISMMAAHHQQSNPSHPFCLGDDDGGGSAGGARAAGPTIANEAAENIYRHQVSSCGAGGVFDYCITPCKSPAGGGMAAAFPFTAAQWKELERQAMIYKCMISSVPVPSHLLFPLSTPFPLDSSFPSVYGGRYSRKGDPEPGRCKRTDGKKWRCSREVAPQQKYCERHLHRGRPRSRKPVEPNNNNNTTPQNQKKTLLQQTKTPPPPPNQLLKAKTNISTSTLYYKETNSLFEAGETASSKQPWEDLMGGFDRDYPLQEPPPPPTNLFSYPEMDLSTGFIDAWSTDNLNSRNNGGAVEPDGDLSPSLDLSMAMSVGNVLDQQMRNIQSECDDDFDANKWLSPVSWEPFARGGPLGEALQPGSVANSRPASPYSNPATTVPSPSGVLHRTLLSHSDGSVCNSPTMSNPFRLQLFP